MKGKQGPRKRLALIFLWLCAVQAGTAQPYPQVDSATISDEWFNQGNSHLINREWSPAIQAFRNALQYAGDEVQQASIHQNLGSLHFLLADYQKATIHFEYALQLLNRVASGQSRIADICLNLGFTWLEIGAPDKAERWFKMAGMRNIQDRGQWSLRLALGTGNVLFSKGSYHEAKSIYTHALAGCDLTMPVTEEEIWLRKNLAWSFQTLGQLDSARQTLDQALDRIRLTGKKKNYTILEIQLQKSLLMTSSNEFREALQLLDDAMSQIDREANLLIDTGNASRQLKTMDVLKYRVLYEKIQAQWRLLNLKIADPIAIHRLYEDVRNTLALGEELASNRRLKDLIFMQPVIQRSLAGIALELILKMDGDIVRQTDDVVSITEGLVWFEEQCYNGNDVAIGILPDSLRASFIGLKQQLFRLHKQRFLEEPQILMPLPQLAGEGVALLKNLFSYDNLWLREHEDNHTDFSTIHLRLHQDEAVIEYLVFDTTLFTILFTADTAILLKQHTGHDFISNVKGFIKALKVLDPLAFIHYSTSLYHLLIAPVEGQIENKFFLRIIPDRQLLALPFDALMIRNREQPGFSGDYLINRHETTCYTSIYAWINGLMNLSDTVGSRTYTYDFGACAPEFSGLEAASIPHATREVENIARLFRSESKKIRTLSGKGISIDTLLALGEQSRIFHMATHGYRDPGHPEFSGWMLPGDPSPSPHTTNPETRLEIGALQSFQMESDLVVLSSCAIGAEQGNTWYRMTGFPTNFFRAGVNHVLFSLWDVSDKHTDDFMSSFYRNYLDGKSYGTALRAAKLQMLSNPETAFPTIWAVFVLWSD